MKTAARFEDSLTLAKTLNAMGDMSSDDEWITVVTGVGPDTTGWFFAIDRNMQGEYVVEQLDGINSCGIVAHDGLVYRILSSSAGDGSSGELLVYDESGVAAYRRIDGLVDPHGVVWNGSRFIVPCPAVNRVAVLTPFGHVDEWIELPGNGDAWHINGVAAHGNELYASAFGRYFGDRDWAGQHAAGKGIVFSLRSLEAVVTGLNCPHDPTFFDGCWVVCDSARQRIVAWDEQVGSFIRSLDLGAWTRGFARNSRALFVGLSGRRHGDDQTGRGALAIVDRTSWQLLDRIDLPCQEVNTVARVPRSMLGALRRGFRTNAMRTSVQDREDMFRTVGNVHPGQPMTPMTPLEPAEAAIRFDAIAPTRIVAGQRFDLRASVVNNGSRTLFSAMPFPVSIGYRWLYADDDREIDPLDERRHALPEPLAPGATLHVSVPLVAPSLPGTYRLRMTLVQEWQRWFDADDAAMGVSLELVVSRVEQKISA